MRFETLESPGAIELGLILEEGKPVFLVPGLERVVETSLRRRVVVLVLHVDEGPAGNTGNRVVNAS